MRLVDIDADLVPAALQADVPELVAEVVSATMQLYAAVGSEHPWIGYLAEVEGSILGTCGFKGPPTNGRVEIAYFTFPGHESKGIATEMGRSLLDIASRADITVRIVAQTLVERNPSHRVLEKLGFRAIGVVQHAEDGEVLEWMFEPPVG